MQQNKKFNWKEISFFTLASILIVIFSFFSSFDPLKFIWENEDEIEKILAIFSGLAGIAGVWSLFFFIKRKNMGFILSITHALFFGLYCFYIKLYAEFLIYCVIYIIFTVFLWLKSKFKDKIKTFNLSKISIILLAFIFIVIFIIFWFLNPNINSLFKNDKTYGQNFNFYYVSRILDTSIISISLVAFIMLLLGINQNSLVWLPKNVLSIIFFSGIGVLSIPIVIINIVYFSISIYMWIKTSKEDKKRIRIAFIGMGGSGKSLLIKELKDFFQEHDIQLFDERDALNDVHINYMKDMPEKEKVYFYQKRIFKLRYKEIIKTQFSDKTAIDRHLIDDFVFPQAHIVIGNFSKWQKIKWNYFMKPYYYLILSMQRKIDIVILVTKNRDQIKENMKNRVKELKEKSQNSEDDRKAYNIRKDELKEENQKFFDEVQEWYDFENPKYKKVLNKTIGNFSKKDSLIISNNEDYKKRETVEKIKEKIIEKMKSK